MGKSVDIFGPIGPFITTLDETGDPNQLRIRFYNNGEFYHDYVTDDIEHKVPLLIQFASTIMTLYSGDVIACGTNHEGLGPLQDGAVVELVDAQHLYGPKRYRAGCGSPASRGSGVRRGRTGRRLAELDARGLGRAIGEVSVIDRLSGGRMRSAWNSTSGARYYPRSRTSSCDCSLQTHWIEGVKPASPAGVAPSIRTSASWYLRAL